MLKGLADDADDKAVEAQRIAGRAELDKRVGATGDVPGLLDAAAKAGASHGPTQTKVLTQLVGKDAGSILEYAVALGLPPKQTLPVLITASDLTTAHVMSLMLAENLFDERMAVLTDDRLRKMLRTALGRKVSPFDVLADSGGGVYLEMAHHKLVNDDALRNWAYEDHDPKTLLWLCAGSVEGTRDGFRHVQADKGLGWVHALPPNVPDDQMLRFVLACKDPKMSTSTSCCICGSSGRLRVHPTEEPMNVIDFVPQYAKMLMNLDRCLEKAIAHAQAKKFDVDTLVHARLAPDQYSLDRQIQSACDSAKFSASYLTGKEAPVHPDTEKTIAELRTRIKSCLAYLETVHPTDVAGAEDRKVSPKWLQGKWVKGEQFLLQMSVPNFYFHVTTAYAILRNNGVDIGKMDYIGPVPMHD